MKRRTYRAKGCDTILASFNRGGRCFVHTPDAVQAEWTPKRLSQPSSLRFCVGIPEELTAAERASFWSGEWAAG